MYRLVGGVADTTGRGEGVDSLETPRPCNTTGVLLLPPLSFIESLPKERERLLLSLVSGDEERAEGEDEGEEEEAEEDEDDEDDEEEEEEDEDEDEDDEDELEEGASEAVVVVAVASAARARDQASRFWRCLALSISHGSSTGGVAGAEASLGGADRGVLRGGRGFLKGLRSDSRARMP